MTLSANKAPEARLQRLRQANRLLLVSHQSPDVDAIGSELALDPRDADIVGCHAPHF